MTRKLVCERRRASGLSHALIVRSDGEFLLAQLFESASGDVLVRKLTLDREWVAILRCFLRIHDAVRELWCHFSYSIRVVHHIAKAVSLDNLVRHLGGLWPSSSCHSSHAIADTNRWRDAWCGLEWCDARVCKIHLVNIPQMIVHLSRPAESRCRGLGFKIDASASFGGSSGNQVKRARHEWILDVTLGTRGASVE